MTAPTTGERERVIDEFTTEERILDHTFKKFERGLVIDEIIRLRDALATAQREAAGLREENVRMRDAVRALLDLPAYQAWERLIMKNTPAPEAGR